MRNIGKAIGEGFLLAIILFVGRVILFELDEIIRVSRNKSALIAVIFLFICSTALVYFRNRGNYLSIPYGIVIGFLMTCIIDVKSPGAFFTGMAFIAFLPFIFYSIPFNTKK